MEKIKSFVNTTFLGGLVVVLPLVILVLVFNWLFDLVAENIRPITRIIIETARLHEFVASILAITIIIGSCFLLGLFVRTRFGNFSYGLFEENILKRIPGYRIIKETVAQLFGSEKNLFSGVALVNLFGNETLITAFITDTHADGSYTVFVPSGPAPTAGFIYHLKEKYVHKIDYPVDLAMKTIISLGAGSKQLYKAYLAGNKN